MDTSVSDQGTLHPLPGPTEHYRLYVDESGDHVLHDFEKPGHRYLCLLGCWLSGSAYKLFHRALEDFKQQHIPHNPDEPLILHREDVVNRRGSYWRLRNPDSARAFDADLTQLVARADFRITSVVVDKRALADSYAVPPHPYNLAMGFLLQRYCGYLNHFNRRGDVMAESRGGVEDRRLKDSYTSVFDNGVWKNDASFFQRALTSRQLKIEAKTANIAGLQLADILAHPIRRMILLDKGLLEGPHTAFAASLLDAIRLKLNRRFCDGAVEDYGTIFSPK
jgi:hypothetical protein